jgi:hypothetical protein
MRNVVLGGPGSGKSSLLRFLAIDVLKDEPELGSLARERGGFLPIWVPFAFWTETVADRPGTTFSLSDIIRRWLKDWQEERLWPLVERALEDERLLLLVDGLDEYKDEQSGTVSLEQLQIFVQQRNIPVVVTSRPHGFHRLGMQTAGWQVAELAGLSLEQQGMLARAWFLHRVQNVQQGPGGGSRNVADVAEAQASRFLDELHGSEDISELAQVPLLLSLLIYLKFVDARLPQNRFKAYDSIVKHLVEKHPHRRRAAALIAGGSSSGFSDDDIIEGFAYLAYRMHEGFGGGLIERGDATAALEDYLRDVELGIGYGRSEARRVSRELMEVGEGTVGLVVKRSPTQLGFFHRAFQEYLAASHLSRMHLEEQLDVVGERCSDPRWREAILGLFHLTRRASDVQLFVQRVKSEQERLREVERLSVQLLLSEVAFGDFNCPVGLARELASDAVEYIELGQLMPQRERLLTVILEGLRSVRVRDVTTAKLREWFPCRRTYRTELFDSISGWPRDSEAEDLLWRGLHDEEGANQRAAARALADLAGGDNDVGNRVAALAYGAVDPDVRTAAIEALIRGWPNHEMVSSVLETARRSASLDLKLVATMGKVRLHEHKAEDRTELMRLAAREHELGNHWQEEVATTLIEGWPRSPDTKVVCLRVVRAELGGPTELERHTALRILLEGYPQDQEVADYCADELRSDDHPFVLLRSYAWHLLAQNFKDHPDVVAATDEWLSRQDVDALTQVPSAAMVGRTQTGKDKLLSLLSERYGGHQHARALLDGWGMQDNEVAEALTQIAFGSAPAASRIGHLLPQIISDQDRCRRRLLDLFQDPGCERPNFVLEGLKRMGVAHSEPDVVDVVLNVLPKHLDTDGIPYRETVAQLTKWFGTDLRLKRLAQKELSRADERYFNVLHVLSTAYANDGGMRQRIAETVCPLPAALRELIATRLGAGYGDDDYALSLLELYELELEEDVKTQASIGYHERLKVLGKEIDPAVRRLSEGIVAVGLDREERRQAAFCGLATLGRLDVLLEARERADDPRWYKVPLTTMLTPNVSMLRHVLKNWDEINAALGQEFWNSLAVFPLPKEGPVELFNLWDAFCAFADEYPSPREEALAYLSRRQERTATPNVLRFLSRTRPGSTLLLEYCLGALDGKAGEYFTSKEDTVLVAAELLGSHFAGDGEVLEHFSKHLASKGEVSFSNEGLLIALCEGWPESEQLQQAVEAARSKRLSSYSVYFHLAALKHDSQAFFESLAAMLEQSSSGEVDFRRTSRPVVRPILRRLRMDNDLHALMNRRLWETPTASEKATLPRLIKSARGMSTDLRAWCAEEIDRQSTGSVPPEVGFDLHVGALRPVPHCLLTVLDAPLTTV